MAIALMQRILFWDDMLFMASFSPHEGGAEGR
jgi:hypothetical protein